MNSWVFIMITKIGKPLVQLTKREKERTQVNKIKYEKGHITKDPGEIQKTIRSFFKILCSVELNILKNWMNF